MAVKIRLARLGKTHTPVYRIVAIDSRKKRDGEALDILGTFNPLTGEIAQFHSDRIEQWIAKGAVPTEAVVKLQKWYKKSAAA